MEAVINSSSKHVRSHINKYHPRLLQVSRELPADEFFAQKQKQEKSAIEGAALGIVIMPDGRIILSERLLPPNKGWALLSGRIEAGEDFDLGFSREVFEETGGKIKIITAPTLEYITYTNKTENQQITLWLALFIAEWSSAKMPTQKEPNLRIELFEPNNLPAKLLEADKFRIINYYNSQRKP